MAPSGIAILLGAGPTTASGIARVLANPSQGNLAVALLSRSASPSLAENLRKSSNGGVLAPFQTDTSESSLKKAFDDIKAHKDFKDLKLKIAIWNIKHSHKTAFEEETAKRFGDSLQIYVTGAMIFAQLSTQWMLNQYPAESEAQPLQKKGTLIFTGTLGALRTNAGYAAYGAGRSGVRMLAQSLSREYSGRGIQVCHAVANGGITDDLEGDKAKLEAGQKIKAESIGKLYLMLSEQPVDLWIHELDMRPAAEKF